jgi:hypothetical protein
MPRFHNSGQSFPDKVFERDSLLAPPFAKLVPVLRGRILDVVVDRGALPQSMASKPL